MASKIYVSPSKLQRFWNGCKAKFAFKPKVYSVELDEDGTILSYSENLTFSNVRSDLINFSNDVYLDVRYNYVENNVQKVSRVHAMAEQELRENDGPIIFYCDIRIHGGDTAEAIFILDSSNSLSDVITLRENALLKTNDIIANASSLFHYPNCLAVYSQFQRKPDIVWEVDGVIVTEGLNAIQQNLSASPAWQLTDLDLTPYKRIKIYSKSGKGSTNASTTAAMILEMSLDSRMASTAWGGNYVASVLSQKPNDNNRYASLTCAVSADKTKFVVLWQSSLYGTAATTNADIGASVVLIEGYYD